jgi:glycosyltransferase involved in cell wall biosynthesis
VASASNRAQQSEAAPIRQEPQQPSLQQRVLNRAVIVAENRSIRRLNDLGIGAHTLLNEARHRALPAQDCSEGGRSFTRTLGQRLLVISPVRNEAEHLERVVRAMAAQTRSPDLWLIVDDHSTDGTYELAEQAGGQHQFITLLRAPTHPPMSKPRDRLASATVPRTFNFALNSVDWRTFTHIGKLDGDIELPPEYFERILGEFEADESLGMAGGLRTELVDGRWWLERIPTEHHVPGALKCYSRECFEAIGGIQETLAWDAIDETLARMRGYRTRTFDYLVAVHHRPWGSADGTLRGRARYGVADYISHSPAYWALLRALKFAGAHPRGIGGLAYLYGYARALLQRTPRFENQEFRRRVHREARGRIFEKLSPSS